MQNTPMLMLTAGIYLFSSLISTVAFADTDRCDLLLHNANVVTMNGKDEKYRSVGIADGRFLFVDNRSHRSVKCDREIDLKGKTIIPGLIDSHIHFLRDAAFPGYDVRNIETATSIADVQRIMSVAAHSAPEGSFLVAKGGFNHRQFVEDRMPTATELDVAAPDRPVYIQEGFRGLGSANSRAMAFFSDKGIRFPEDGVISSRLFGAVETALRSTQTTQDKLRETKRLMEQASRWGLTTIVDQGDTPSGYNPDTHYNSIITLWRQKRLPIRVRLSLLSYDDDSSFLLEQRLRNNFMGFGDGSLKIVGVGEHIVTYPGLFSSAPPDGGALLLRKMLHIAEKGWTYTQHSSSLEQNRSHASIMAEVNEQFSIEKLHWSLAHATRIGEAELNSLRELGVGLTLQNHAYLRGEGPAAGPPYRRILDSGVKAGGGTDARGGSPMNPWMSIYYMVTGKNSSGNLINAGQTIGRDEALRMYTRDNAWFIKEDAALGSIEAGKSADLVVLSADYFDVPDDEIRTLTSLLTIVDGEIVHEKL